MKVNCVNDVLSWFDDACKNSSYGLVVGDDGKFRTRAYFVSMQFVRGVSTGSLLVIVKMVSIHRESFRRQMEHFVMHLGVIMDDGPSDLFTI